MGESRPGYGRGTCPGTASRSVSCVCPGAPGGLVPASAALPFPWTQSWLVRRASTLGAPVSWAGSRARCLVSGGHPALPGDGSVPLGAPLVLPVHSGVQAVPGETVRVGLPAQRGPLHPHEAPLSPRSERLRPHGGSLGPWEGLSAIGVALLHLEPDSTVGLRGRAELGETPRRPSRVWWQFCDTSRAWPSPEGPGRA